MDENIIQLIKLAYLADKNEADYYLTRYLITEEKKHPERNFELRMFQTLMNSELK